MCVYACIYVFNVDHANAWAPMEEWENRGLLPDFRKNGEDSWEDQVVREVFFSFLYLSVRFPCVVVREV